MRRIFYLFSYFYFLVTSVPVQANSVVVVTDQRYPVYNLPEHTRLIELDAAERLHEQLSADLPANQQQAEQMARTRLARDDKQLSLQMQTAFQNILDAWAFGIHKIPAVALDGYVVYGQTDVQQAVWLINQYRELHP